MVQVKTQPTTETPVGQIWSRLVRPKVPSFSPEMAEYFLSLDFSTNDTNRMNELAAKGRGGTLTDEEDKELEAYIQVDHVIGLLQSKARVSLRQRGSQE